MTFCPWYLAAAKTASIPDVFLAEDNIQGRLAYLPEYPLTPAGTTLIDLYVMTKQIILLGVCTISGTPSVFR